MAVCVCVSAGVLLCLYFDHLQLEVVKKSLELKEKHQIEPCLAVKSNFDLIWCFLPCNFYANWHEVCGQQQSVNAMLRFNVVENKKTEPCCGKISVLINWLWVFSVSSGMINAIVVVIC